MYLPYLGILFHYLNLINLDIILDLIVVVSIYKNKISSGILFNGLCKLNLNTLYAKTLLNLHHNVGIKRGLVNECSTYLW